ncbi:TPA: DeoR/GlpR family DNA-binding transcription regulator [Clostridioides difficile]|uniref:DeoR/GlpR family DNA-binding transcription regulator n=1 Tax=Clostridioides difficile TaxID=1496 RepID=UPI00093D24E7|nr:DeoR/GlpR family DNA-binding transcription regulator [Clostridioides difficile]EII6783241.1 DeoR/GlpR transcriptional regulator [Clostridioides difficile]MBJ9784158.1 DeoR/GlpR transcriptional regulator [Clostridioides difficile]MBY2758960.1 DeoR/GlpR family DNA-binding transcription regulator [Clostridioides difficile]MCE4650703.1 DeoR/GlpR family DNA-binding transcription regulator [Clostridioides difficile]MCL6885064.1 DeoR/GlpR family DNA-binding transcription regulator [Clostridioides 
MSLNSIDRKKEILKLLDSKGKVNTKELVKRLEVSSETIRRYLEELENENKLKKVYGGAIKINYGVIEPEHIKRNNTNLDKKQSIAKYAAKFVNDNESIIIDEGTTNLQIVDYIISINNLKIITNSYPVLSKLISYENQGLFDGEVIFIGGKVNLKHQRTACPMSIDTMKNLYVDKAFISSEGILDSFGISSIDQNKALLSKEYIKNSKESFVLCDSSKIGIASMYKIADLEELDFVICDVEPPNEWKDKLNEINITWIEAK